MLPPHQPRVLARLARWQALETRKQVSDRPVRTPRRVVLAVASHDSPRVRFFKKIQDWILKSEMIRKWILRFFTR